MNKLPFQVPCKITCDNWYWSKKLQESVSELTGWGRTRWTRSKQSFVIDYKRVGDGVWMGWSTVREFKELPYQEYNAREIVKLMEAL